MLRRTVQTFCVLLVVAVLTMFVVSNVTAQENRFAKYYDEGVIALGGGLVTGATLNEMQDEIDGSIEEMDLDDSRCFGFYKVDYDEGGSVYIAINENTGKLVYKLSFYDVDKKESIKNYLEKKCGNPIKERGTLFYYYKDLGFKVTPYNDDVFQLWVGSVARWDNAAEDTSFNPFEK